jgi:hypothetical protein
MEGKHELAFQQQRCKETMEAFLTCDVRNLFVCLPRRSGVSYMLQKFRSGCTRPTTLVTLTRRQALEASAGPRHKELLFGVDECTPVDDEVWIYESCIVTDALAESWRLRSGKAIWFVTDGDQFGEAPTQDKMLYCLPGIASVLYMFIDEHGVKSWLPFSKSAPIGLTQFISRESTRPAVTSSAQEDVVLDSSDCLL